MIISLKRRARRDGGCLIFTAPREPGANFPQRCTENTWNTKGTRSPRRRVCTLTRVLRIYSRSIARPDKRGEDRTRYRAIASRLKTLSRRRRAVTGTGNAVVSLAAWTFPSILRVGTPITHTHAYANPRESCVNLLVFIYYSWACQTTPRWRRNNVRDVRNEIVRLKSIDSF